VEFTCTVFSVTLTGMFKVTFCMNYEKCILIVPNFREIRVTHTPQPTRTHTHTHTHQPTRAHTDTHTHHTHTHTHTHTTLYLSAREYINCFISSFPVAL